MEMHDGYVGVFLPKNQDFSGHPNISCARSVVTLTGKKSWPDTGAECADIHGVFGDGRKTSLLHSVLTHQTGYGRSSVQFESAFFPNYVVVGDEFILSDEPVIQAIRYHFEQASGLLSGHKTFRSIIPDREEVRRLLEQEHQRSQKIAQENG